MNKCVINFDFLTDYVYNTIVVSTIQREKAPH